MGKKAKELVKLRFRKLKNGETSAYFDVYSNGVREYLWQQERLLPETDDAAREHNRNLLTILEQRRRSLTAELTIDKSGIADRSFNTDMTLLQWLEIYKKELSGRAKDSYMSGVSRISDLLKSFRPDILLKDVNEGFAVLLYEYLKAQPAYGDSDHTVTEGTIWYFLKILGNCMNGAIRERLVDHNPFKDLLSACRKRQKKRCLTCLSQKDIVKLLDTPYEVTYVKRVFLFACFTGVTPEMLHNLCWKHIYKKDGRTWAILKRTRSGNGETISIPLTDMAIACLPHRCRAKGSCPVFEHRNIQFIRFHLKIWREKAGITSPMNFRVARNTYASLLLDADADLYTAGYMMGFSSTTYMMEYEGYINAKRYDSVEKMDAEFSKIIEETKIV